MSAPKVATFTPGACLSAVWHARDNGSAVIEYDDAVILLTRHPRTRIVQNTDLLVTVDGETKE